MENEKIIQFGEGNFLRGFVDYFIYEMNKKNNFNGSVVVVQPLINGMISDLNKQDGKYSLFLRGVEKEIVKENQYTIDVISRGIDPYANFEDYMKLAHQDDLRFIISNTTESGIQVNYEDKYTDQPASSFPGKLTQLLHKRFLLQKKGFIFLPCELIDDNGTQLKECVLEYAKTWELSEEFIEWIHSENYFLNTLVDRIVTGYPKNEIDYFQEKIDFEDKLIDTAELFHLWVIEGNFESEIPLQKTGLNVIWTNNVKPYKERKVRILNGAHTCLVPYAMLKGYQEVNESLQDSGVNEFLRELIFDEIIPTLSLPKEEMIDFAEAVFERFKNPFIHHSLRAIALNSFDKFKVRVIPSIIKYQNKYNKEPKNLMIAFNAFYDFYYTDMVNDSQDKIDFVRSHTREEVFIELCK